MNTCALKNSKGQAILEMLVVFILILGAWTAVSTFLRKSGTFETVFGTPWARLSNVVEFGVPNDKSASTNGGIHPAYPDRHSTRIQK